jgi:hypothetical protein
METGADYEGALAEAQRLGFAEADPTADVEGLDVQAKIALLAKLAFGVTVPVQQVPCSGISRLSVVDFEYARILKSTIKLLGTAGKNSDGTVSVYVSPAMVPLSSPLAAAKGPGNTVLLQSENLGLATSFAGPGAGRYPTANSIVSDILRIAQDTIHAPFPLEVVDIVLNNDYQAKFYIRIKCCDGLGIIRMVGEAAEQHHVSIHAILQNPIENPSELDFVVVTESVKLSSVQNFVQAVASMPFSKEIPLYMNIL